MPSLAAGTDFQIAPKMPLQQKALEQQLTAQQLRLILLPELQESGPLRNQWNQLVFAMEEPEVFYTYEWALAVQRAYSGLLKPLFMLAYQGESLAGAAALATDLRGREATCLCSTTADYCDFLSHPGVRVPFIDAIFAQLRSLQVSNIVLPNLPADSASVEAIKQACSKYHFHFFSRPAYACARVVLGSQQQRADIKASLQRKKMLQRSLNHLSRQGPVQLSHLKTREEICQELPRFVRAHVARFLSTGRMSNQVRAERRRFLEELAGLLGDCGWLNLTRLMVGEMPVAWNYGFQFAGSWFWYQPTLDTKFEKYSPGLCLLSKMIEEACDQSTVRMIDLGLGAEGYKERFSTATRQTLCVTVCQRRADHVKQAARFHAAQLAKASPSIEGAARRLLRRFTTARQILRNSHFRGLARWVYAGARQSFFGNHEVLFYQWRVAASPKASSANSVLSIQSINLEVLALAGLQYAEDSATLNYLLRCATRLRSDKHAGFALLSQSGIPVHFVWVAPFGGFYLAELNHELIAPSPESFLLFDCWTPVSVRGEGFYQSALQLVATKLAGEGKSPWIFSASTNESSLRAIEKSGFHRCYSLIRRKRLRRQTVEIRELPQTPSYPLEVWAGA